MTVQCGACSTENRDAAKFCKGCGRKIAQAWPQEAQAIAVGGGAAALQMGAVASTPRASAPEIAMEVVTAAGSLISSARITNGRWIGAMALGVAVLVLTAAAWGLKNRSSNQIEAPVTPAVATPQGAQAPATPQVVEPAKAMPAPVPPPTSAAQPAVESTAAELPVPSSHAEPAAEKSATAPAKSRKVTPKKPLPQAPAPVVEVAQPVPAPAPAPARVTTPQEACAGRNFIARAQCMAEQCARADMASQPQCEAVRRQQRIDEEKRNPTNAG